MTRPPVPEPAAQAPPSESTAAPDDPGPSPEGHPPPTPSDATGPAVVFELQTHDTAPPAAGWLEPRLAEACVRAGVTGGELAVTLIDDAAMAALHAEHRGEPATTDVLTFDLRDPDATPNNRVEGDLVVCRDEAQRQADARGHTAREELLLYAVHGLLHLLGEDDYDPAAADRMHRREDALLTAIGLGPIYGGAAP
ncbi:MAG: rRNA maturation RNase YbeY [Planctomycetota bacterium]